jgi:hypothetical protein
MSNLEELGKKFIASGDLEKEELEELLNGLDGWFQVSPEDGYVKINEKFALSDKTKLHLILTARYLVNKLQNKLGQVNPVKESMTLDELASNLRISKKEVSRRISDLRISKRVEDVERGEIRVTPYSIKVLIEELNKKRR